MVILLGGKKKKKKKLDEKQQQVSIKTYHTKFPANQVTLTRANNLELVGMWIQPKKKFGKKNLWCGVYLTNCAETLDIGPLCLTTEAITNEKKKCNCR